MSAIHTLLVDCPDEKGLIHRVTEVLFHHGLNIEDQEEFVQKEAGYFFMRTEFSGTLAAESVLAELHRLLPISAHIKLQEHQQKRIVILVGKELHCLGELLLRNELGELPAEISAVIGNHDNGRQLSDRFGVPFHLVPHREKEPASYEPSLLETLEQYQPDYVVLAKFMRILSAQFVDRYPQRILNIHHSFLPAFAGAKPYHQAYERGVKIIGASGHFVTPQLDQGPIIVQDVIPVRHDMSPEDMMRAGRDIERLVLARALRLVLEDRVFVFRNRTIVFEY